MDDPLFLTENQICVIHSEQIELFGGGSGILSPELLSSAVMQPQNLYFYTDNVSLFDIASAYAFFLGKNHAFQDGNKRVGSAAAIAFLDVNGILIRCSFADEMIALVSDEISREEFSNILQRTSFEKGGLTAFIRNLFDSP